MSETSSLEAAIRAAKAEALEHGQFLLAAAFYWAWDRRCAHQHVRCIHGDEILSTTRAWRTPTWARSRCLNCGRALYDVDMPDRCWWTNEDHASIAQR